MRPPGDEKDYAQGESHAMAGNGKWTDEEIRDLGATTDLQALAGIFGCSAWMSYKMARTGEWERQGIKIFRIGAFYRVGVPSILDVLGFSSPGSSSPETVPDDELAAADEYVGRPAHRGTRASDCRAPVVNRNTRNRGHLPPRRRDLQNVHADLSAASACLRGVIQFPDEAPVLNLHALTDRLSQDGEGDAE
jgi:hypothetical protein